MIVERYLPMIRRNTVAGLVVSAGFLALAFVLRYFAALHIPFVTFFPAVLLAAFVSGRWAGLVTTGIAAVLAYSFFLPDAGYLPDLIAFVVVCILLTVMGDATATALERMQRATERHAVLLREIAHRLKNQYAVITAITHSLGREAHSIEDFDRLLTEKLQGLASSHDLLVSGSWDGASLRELVNAHLLPFCSKARFRAEGKDITLDAQAVQYLGMAFHELCTNASKYGALRDKDGTISIVWNTDDNGLTVRWEERFGHVVPEKTQSAGFGNKVLTLIAPAALQGKAELEHFASGLRWTLSMPLTDRNGI
jgi:two-component sensor histidine kinase